MENQKEQKHKIIYFSDLYHLLVETTEEIIEDSRGEQSCCIPCGGVRDDKDCECIKRKERRDGTSECFMSIGSIGIETGCEIVTKIANKIVEALRERSFICECPPVIEMVRGTKYEKKK